MEKIVKTRCGGKDALSLRNPDNKEVVELASHTLEHDIDSVTLKLLKWHESWLPKMVLPQPVRADNSLTGSPIDELLPYDDEDTLPIPEDNMPSLMSAHQLRVEQFMEKAGQDIPPTPTIPSQEVRKLRAKLIMEEALETVRALGFDIVTEKYPLASVTSDILNFIEIQPPNLVEIIDGCADIIVVTTGTASACGVEMGPIQEEVDYHNLAKFGEGSYRREDGKWMKPPNLEPPRIWDLLIEQGLENPTYEICEPTDEAKAIALLQSKGYKVTL